MKGLPWGSLLALYLMVPACPVVVMHISAELLPWPVALS